MGGLITKREEVLHRPFRNVLSQYEGRKAWMNDDKFLQDLEGDSVDTDILDEELQALEPDESSTWRLSLHKFIEWNPVQIAMCILVLIDAGVVVAEIILDLNAIRLQSEETTMNLGVAVGFFKRKYPTHLAGYEGDDIYYIIDKLDHYDSSRESRSVDHGMSDPTPPLNSDLGLQRHKQYNDSDVEAIKYEDRYLISSNNISSTQGRPLDSEEFPGFQAESGNQVKWSNSTRENPELSTESLSHDNTDKELALSETEEKTGDDHGGHSRAHLAHELLEVAHIIHFISIAILGIFVIQVILKIVALGKEFFYQKMEICDAVVVIASFVLDLVFVRGVTDNHGEEAIAVIMIFLLWRILRIINGMMLTSKKRQEFRIKLQKRARRKLEKKMECLLEDKEWRERELTNLKGLCMNKGITEEELRLCKPRRRSIFQKLTTSSGLSSIASLSIGLSLSGPLVMKSQIPVYPMLPRSCRTSLAGTTTGTKSTRSSSTSLERVWMAKALEQAAADNSDSFHANKTHRVISAASCRNPSEEKDEEGEEGVKEEEFVDEEQVDRGKGDVASGRNDSIDETDEHNDNCAISMTENNSAITDNCGLASIP